MEVCVDNWMSINDEGFNKGIEISKKIKGSFSTLNEGLFSLVYHHNRNSVIKLKGFFCYTSCISIIEYHSIRWRRDCHKSYTPY